MVCGPLSSYTCFQGPHMHLQSCKWEFAHTLFYDFLSSSLFIFFFFKPAISLPEPVESADFFSLDVYRFIGGVHGHTKRSFLCCRMSLQQTVELFQSDTEWRHFQLSAVQGVSWRYVRVPVYAQRRAAAIVSRSPLSFFARLLFVVNFAYGWTWELCMHCMTQWVSSWLQ